MTEELTDAQLEGAEEEQELPTPTISAGSTDAGSEVPSFDADTLVGQIVERLKPEVDELVDSRFKSGKDVRFSKVDEIYEWVKASGGDPEKIRMTLERSAYEDRLAKLEAQLTDGAGGTAPASESQERFDANRAAEILNEADVSWGDPDIEAWSQRSFTSEAQAESALRAIVSKRTKQENITPAATVASPGKSVVVESSDDYDSLAKKLSELRGKFDPESQTKRKEIQSKMEVLERDLVFITPEDTPFG